MKYKARDKPEKFKEIARERIEILFEKANEMFSFDHKLSDRYVELARSIAMRLKVKIPPRLKRRFCKKCHSYLMPGSNCQVRAHEGKMVYHCKVCKNMMKFPYNREQKEKRKKSYAFFSKKKM